MLQLGDSLQIFNSNIFVASHNKTCVMVMYSVLLVDRWSLWPRCVWYAISYIGLDSHYLYIVVHN